MKKLLTILGLLVCMTSKAQTPDVLLDSVYVVSPYWGLRFESGVVQAQDSFFLNCGSSNVNFVAGQPYLLARFPIQLANMGNGTAYFGTLGSNGITHDPCYNSQFYGPTDYVNIPNFVTSYILDSCGNVVSWNRKTDWNIQNGSQYIVSPYNGQITYLTQYFGLSPTTGTAPNPLKDWLESKCGPINTNIASIGKSLMDNYYNNCQACDSLVLFPNYVSNDQGIVQLPVNLAPGNYYLAISANFYMLNQGSNCFSDSLVIPFNWNGATGMSSTYPYFANGITFLSQGFGPCVPPALPTAPSQVSASTNGVSTSISWNSNNTAPTYYRVTPYVLLSGNSEKAINSLSRDFSSTSASYLNQELRGASEITQLFGVPRNNLKFRFRVKAVNAAGTSVEVSSGNPAVQIK